MLNAEFVRAIAEQAVNAATPQVREVDPTKDFAVKLPSGEVAFLPSKPARREHFAQDLETIVANATRPDFPRAAIWYSRNEIICLMDDYDRRDTVSVHMVRSDQIKQLMGLEEAKPQIDQRALVFMLRTVFTPAAFVAQPNLIDALRQVKFESGQKVEGNIQRGKTSIGKEASAAATFMQDVPETVQISVPLFHNSFAFRTYDVNCALEIKEDVMKFQLFPLPGEVERAFAAAEADISKSLRDLLGKESPVPVYYGTP